MDIDKLIEKLKSVDDKNLRILTQREVKAVCRKAKEILAEESNVQPVRAPVVVAGDIHGQYFDLLHLFSLGGELPGSNYVFIGDFVDRGAHSIETIELLLCLKIKYPSHITLLRGNHESRSTSSQYGFTDEIKRKYGNEEPWHYFMDVFDYLPIGAIIENDVFCVHGGLSPSLKTIDQIRQIDRVVEVPVRGPYSDLLWSDPEEGNFDWRKSERGAGYRFGARPVKDFNHINGISLIARAHQLVEQGYHFWFKDQNLVTVWSAPNYTYRCGNKAAIMLVEEDLTKNFKVFDAVEKSKTETTDIQKFFPYFL